MYRMQVYDRRTTGMHWQIGKGGGFHYKVAESRGQALPVTVFLGGPPAMILSAIAPLPENVPELMLASLIAGERLEARDRARAAPPHRRSGVRLDRQRAGSAAPAGRAVRRPLRLLLARATTTRCSRSQAIARRKDAIYPATVVGKPRQEDFFIGDLLQDLLSPLFPLVMPAVIDLWSYGETGYHSLAGAVVRERYRREAMASAFRILGEGQLSLTKFLLLTDRTSGPAGLPRDARPTCWRARSPDQDLFVFSNVSMDTLDYTGPSVNEGSKGVWLGPRRPRARPAGALPVRRTCPPAPATSIVFCPGCLVVGGPRYADEPGAAARFARHAAFRDWPLVVVTDEPRRAAASAMNFLWTTFTRFEPGADIHAAATRVVRNHVSFTPPIVIDARMKPWYPAEVSCAAAIARRVGDRWREYFPGGVEMGDSEAGHLDAPC